MTEVRWAAYGDWSGPWVRGTRAYTPAAFPTSWENVLIYAVAKPEGGAWDTHVAYDGTAATAGLFQWTLTSTRLQKLLEVCRTARPTTFAATVGKLLADWHLVLQGGQIRRDNGTVLTTSELRAKFTPPDGKTPKTGTNWDLAKRSAIAFNALFLDPQLDAVQQEFFLKELQAESKLKRPKLGGATIESILYPNGWRPLGEQAIFLEDAPRSMFWSFWQNAPRKAEEYLLAANNEIQFKNDPMSFVGRLSRKFAHSTFGNWGIEKAAENNRTARYTKIVDCINSQMACKLAHNP